MVNGQSLPDFVFREILFCLFVCFEIPRFGIVCKYHPPKKTSKHVVRKLFSYRELQCLDSMVFRDINLQCLLCIDLDFQ